MKIKRLKVRFVIAVGVFLLLCMFPEKVLANILCEDIKLYYYSLEKDSFETENFCFYGEFKEEEKALIIFDNLFENNDDGKVYFIPKGAKVLDIKIKDDILVLNASKEMMNYGGTAYEKALIKQIAINALNFQNITKITIMIDGNYSVLAEGSFVFEYEIGEILSEI